MLPTRGKVPLTEHGFLDATTHPATIVGWWLPSGTVLTPTELPPPLEPGATVDHSVTLVVPQTAGVHTLVLDIVTPERGSLMAAGIGPTVVRITVVETR